VDSFLGIVIGLPLGLLILGGIYLYASGLSLFVGRVTRPLAQTAAERREDRELDRLLREAEKDQVIIKKMLERYQLK
jgi:hypothetical protein